MGKSRVIPVQIYRQLLRQFRFFALSRRICQLRSRNILHDASISIEIVGLSNKLRSNDLIRKTLLTVCGE